MESFKTLLEEYENGEIDLLSLICDCLQFFDNDIHSVIEALADCDCVGMTQDELLEFYDEN